MATVHKTRNDSTIGGLLHTPNLPILLIVAAMVVGLAALLPLVQSSSATTMAGKVRQLEQERADWQARVREAELGVATLGSLNRIEREAKIRLKMTQPATVHYISADAPPPEPRKLPGRFLPAAPERVSAGSSLIEDLFGWLPLP